MEALRTGMPIKELLFARRAQGLAEIQKTASSQNIKFKEVSPEFLEQRAKGLNHQGVLAELKNAHFEYADLDAVFEKAVAQKEKVMVAILDEIVDPHNLGAIIRSAVCAGFHGVIISKHRSAEINATVMKTSVGAAAHIPIIQASNLAQTLKDLKDRGVWIYGTAMESDQNYYEIDAKDHVGVVIGSEGSGMRRLTKEKCDFLIKIPLHGPIESLNASVAAGIVFFEMRKQRSY
jgi:23S rRNA (guanosine2251-2'-O)-methyltransferase